MVARIFGLMLLILVNGCTMEPPPEWTLGSSSSPGTLAAVGVGASLEEAQRQALRTLTEQCSWMPGGGDSLRGAMRIAETWHDRRRDNYQALAVIDRQSAVMPLLDALSALDREIAGRVAAADRAEAPLRRWGHEVKAVALAETRGALAAEVARHDLAVAIPAGGYSWEQLTARRDRTARPLGLDAGAFDDPDDLVKNRLVRNLAAQGLRLAPRFAAGARIAGTARAMDTRVTARIEVLAAGGERVALVQVEESGAAPLTDERLLALLIDELTQN